MNSQTLNFFVKIPCGNVLRIPAVFARIRLRIRLEARIRIEIQFRIRAEVIRTWGNPDPQQWPHLQYNFSFLFLLQNYKYHVFSDSTLRASATGATYTYPSWALRQPHRLSSQLQQVILKIFFLSQKRTTFARIRIRIRLVWSGFGSGSGSKHSHELPRQTTWGTKLL